MQQSTMQQREMQLREFSETSANCGTALADAFPNSAAVVQEVGAFLAMDEWERQTLYSSIDVLAYATNCAHKHGLESVDAGGQGPAWGVAHIRGKQLFAFRTARDWWGQTAGRGIVKLTGARIVQAWSVD